MIIRPLYPRRKPDYLLLFMLLWLAVILLSCNVLKSKRSRSEQVDSVSRRTAAVVDTGSGGNVSRGTSSERAEWERAIYQYPRDTSVVNLHPTTVIYERGASVREETRTDSTWFKNALSSLSVAVDSLSRRMAEQSKAKETTTNPVYLMLMCLAGYWILTTGIPWLAKRIKFVKPV